MSKSKRASLFQVNERVLCFHGPLIYEAKVLKVSPPEPTGSPQNVGGGGNKGSNVSKRPKLNVSPAGNASADAKVRTDNEKKCVEEHHPTTLPSPKYFVHYHGWNKNWDEWVQEGRVLKYSEPNLERQRQLLVSREISKQRLVQCSKSVASSSQLPSSHRDQSEKDGTSSQQVKLDESEKDMETLKNSCDERKLLSTHSTTTSTSPCLRSSSVKSSCNESSENEKTEEGDPLETKSDSEVSKIEEKTDSFDTNFFKDDTQLTQLMQDHTLQIERDATLESELEFRTKVEINIRFPEDLKAYLVDDWNYITKLSKLLTLPAEKSVKMIVDEYVQTKSKSNHYHDVNNSNHTLYRNVGDGLIEYFNVMLGSQLLYKFERLQYSEIFLMTNTTDSNSKKSPSEIYGSVHLLRLFVKIGPMLVYTDIDAKSMSVLVGHLQDFLGYIRRNRHILFDDVKELYGTASPEYLKMSM